MWKKMKALDFQSHVKPIYDKGCIANFIEFTTIRSVLSLKETLYIKYANDVVIGIIRFDKTKASNSFTSILKTESSFHIRNLYSETLEEAKLKSDLFLIEQGYKINFPGV